MSGATFPRSRNRSWVIAPAFLSAIVVVLVGCPAPFDIDRVERPPFDNPVDPDARIDLLEILNGEDENGNPLVPDANLRNVLAETGARYTSDVTELKGEERNIVSLEGLEYFPRLVRIDVSNNDDAISTSRNVIVDLSPLIGHPNLEELDVAGVSATAADPAIDNDLSAFDLASLAGIPRLSSLNISNVGIADLTGIERVETLRSLDVSGSDLAITAVAPFPPLTNLTTLRYDGSQASASPPSDFAFLSQTPSLQTLSMTNSSITTFDGIAVLTDLRNLSLDWATSLSTLDGIEVLANLETVSVRGVDAALAPLSGRTELREIYATDRAGGTPIGVLSNLPSLETLEISNSGLGNDDVANLAGLTALQTLSLRGNIFTDISPLSNLLSLRYLDIAETANTTSLDPLGSLTNLEELEANTFQFSPAQTFDFFSTMSSLRRVSLSDYEDPPVSPPVVTLDGFAGTAAEEIYLSGIELSTSADFSFALSTPNLRDFFLTNEAALYPVLTLDPFSATSLEQLSLSGFPAAVELASFEDFSFAQALPNLRYVDIENDIGSFPAVDLSFFEDTNLDWLGVNDVTPFNADRLPESVEYLRLESCGISTPVGGGLLDEIATSLPSLRELRLANNPGVATVAALSAGLSQLDSLVVLDISVTYLTGGVSADGGVNGVEALGTLPSLSEVNLSETDAARNSTGAAADPTGVFQLQNLLGAGVNASFTP